MRARKTGDPKKETAAARRRRLKNTQRGADEVLAKRAPQPSTRNTNKMSSEAKRTASVIKEGKKRTEKQKYRSEKTFRKESIRNISDSRAARLKNRFDKNVAKEDRVKGEASRGFDDTRGTKKGSVSKSRGKFVDTTKGAATLSKSRGKKVVKAVDRDKAMKLKKKYSKFAKGGKTPVVPPKPGDPGYDERDFRATDEYKKKLKKRARKTRKAAIAKTAIGKKFKGAAARHAHRRVLDFKGKKYEYKPRKYKPKADTTYAAGGKFPDLTGDGKVTRADVLKGRGVFRSGGKVPTGKYKTSDGREITKSSAREAAINEIKRKTRNKVSKAHKQGEKRGKKVVGRRRVIKAGNPRTLSGGVEYKNVYKKEVRKEKQGANEQ